MVADCEDQRKSAEDLLSKNLARAVEITKELETNYRTIGLFYKNTEADKVKKYYGSKCYFGSVKRLGQQLVLLILSMLNFLTIMID